MRFVLIAVATLALVGCGETAPPFVLQLPTAPNPPVAATPDPPPAPPVPTPPAPPAPPRELTSVWVLVLEGSESGRCVPDARVEIVSGQGLGRSRTQLRGGCDFWSDPDYDAIFRELNVGEELIFRASASGFAAKERAVVPTSGQQSTIHIALSRIQ